MINYNKALINAVHSSDYELLEMAIAGGADITAFYEPNILYDNVSPGIPPIPNGVMALHRAVRMTNERELTAEHLQIVRRLIEIGVNVNDKPYPDKGSYPLHHAVYTGHEALIRLLLERGATIWTTGDEGGSLINYAGGKGINWFIELFIEKLQSKQPDEKVMRGFEGALDGAARYGHLETVRLLLDFGMDPNSGGSSSRGNSLMTAAAWGHEDVVNLLLARGANRHMEGEKGQTVLISAAQGELTELALRLIEEGASVSASSYYSRTPLCGAAAAGDERLARELVKRGANLKSRDHGKNSVLHSAAYGGNKWIIEACLAAREDANVQNDWGYTPLMKAAQVGQVEAMEILVAHGADVNHVAHYEGETALHSAIYGSRVEAVQWLLEQGADVEAPVDSDPDVGSTTPLGLAASKNNMELVQLLIRFGARLFPVEEPPVSTPLHDAAIRELPEMVAFFLSLGMPVDVRNEDGDTPLVYARGGEVTRLLLEAGADPYQRDGRGATRFWLSGREGSVEIGKVLLQCGADPFLRDASTSQTPREVAAANGHIRFVRMLDEYLSRPKSS